MTGQEAVNVAQAFHERIAFDGVVLTKLDGDARGGAALSRQADHRKADQVRVDRREARRARGFHPDRMASRILGMGDVLTLIERAEQSVEEDEQAEMEKRHAQGKFTFDDFLKAQKMLHRMGRCRVMNDPGNRQAAWRPRRRRQAACARRGDRALDDAAAACDPAPHRRLPPSDRERPGATVEQVNQLLLARKEMEKMMKQMGKGRCRTCRAATAAQQPPLS